MSALRDIDFFAARLPNCLPRTRVVVNVGSNKGYVAATLIGLWDPASRVSPQDLYDFLGSVHVGEGVTDQKPRRKCGICDDCKRVLPPAPRTAPSTSVSVVVHAIEPQPSNVDLLRGYADVHRSRGGNSLLLPHWFGLSNANGTGLFEERGAGDEGSSLGNSNRNKGPLVAVPLLSVDSFMSAYVDPEGAFVLDILYMDTEGYDPAVLDGAALTLPWTRLVVFEYNNLGLWTKTTLRQTVGMMDTVHGFDCYFEWDRSLVRLTGGCWVRSCEFRQFANVLCVNRRDESWALVMKSRAWPASPESIE